MNKLAFSSGHRQCVGNLLAQTQLMTVLIILAREVKQIDLSSEEQARVFSATFGHPTGMPGTVVGC